MSEEVFSLVEDVKKANLDILFFFDLTYKNASGVDIKEYFHVNGANEVLNEDKNRIELVNTMRWQGKDYTFVGIDIKGFKLSDGGQVSSPKLRVSNKVNGIENYMIALCFGTRNLKGAKISVYMTSARAYANNTGQYRVQHWWIDRLSALNVSFAEFELKSPLDFRRQQIPTRLISPYCTWAMRGQYRGESCGYTGDRYFDKQGNPVPSIAQDVCSGLIGDCENRFGKGETLRHGGFLVNFNTGN